MKKIIISLIFILLLILISFSDIQAQVDTLWTKTFGGNSGDWGYSVQQTTDGGYIITGKTLTFGAGETDVWLIKTDVSGEIIWTKTYGGVSIDEGLVVQQTTDGGYIVTGMTTSFGSYNNYVWLIKTDDSGDTLWTKTYEGNYGSAVQQTSDGGYIITGTTSSGSGNEDALLIKTDISGNIIWIKTFGGVYTDGASCVQQTLDGGYIITGNTSSFGPGLYNVWLIRTNASGDTLWTKTYGGNDDYWSHSIQQTSDGGFIIAGAIFQNSIGNFDILLIRTDAFGDTLWIKNFGGALDSYGHSAQQTSDGGFIIIGRIDYFIPPRNDIWLIKSDAFGDTVWTKTFGGNYEDWGFAVEQTHDKGYIITGHTSSFGTGSEDIWLIKTTADLTNIETTTGIVPSDFSLSQNYPNPFNPSTVISYHLPVRNNVTLKVYDVLGNEISTLLDEYKPAGSYEVEWLARNQPSGVYFYQIITDEFIATRKMILIK
ncbi:MAG: T9SS type A sorting domain-containing protein [bacterium]|nr:T9SS type A sorting domain-containing protein [bacterium]